jgi:prepilin-type N-terminal cleavage/methylation domain-containing protein
MSGAAGPGRARPSAIAEVGSMNRRSGFTLIELMIVVAIIAVIIAIAIPGLLRARISSNERSASASLKAIVTAQENFHSNDLDRNRVNDYWTANVAGLYCLTSSHTGQPIAALNDIGVATADLDSMSGGAMGYSGDTDNDGEADVFYNPAALLSPAQPKSGYVFQILLADEKGDSYLMDTDWRNGPVHNFGKYGFMAVPIQWDSTGNYCFIVNEGATVFRRDFGETTLKPQFYVPHWSFDTEVACVYPPGPELSLRWSKIE